MVRCSHLVVNPARGGSNLPANEKMRAVLVGYMRLLVDKSGRERTIV